MASTLTDRQTDRQTDTDDHNISLTLFAEVIKPMFV